MSSSHSELKKISEEMKIISLKKRQFLERKKMLCIFQELRNQVHFEQTEEAVSYQHEIDSIDGQLKELTERNLELQKSHESILSSKDKKSSEKQVSFASTQKIVPQNPHYAVFFVEPPPDIPAPKVILDVEKLPAYPCRTQCPECQQFIMTETFTSISSITWMVCLMTALIGCVAGCCLIPFCMDRFKTTTHRCPKCRTLIKSIKTL